jgi:hypothetical protein
MRTQETRIPSTLHAHGSPVKVPESRGAGLYVSMRAQCQVRIAHPNRKRARGGMPPSFWGHEIIRHDCGNMYGP